ncbi:hypothetical protein LTR16_006020, partial [Cryomyces antarcticus]
PSASPTCPPRRSLRRLSRSRRPPSSPPQYRSRFPPSAAPALVQESSPLRLVEALTSPYTQRRQSRRLVRERVPARRRSHAGPAQPTTSTALDRMARRSREASSMRKGFWERRTRLQGQALGRSFGIF